MSISSEITRINGNIASSYSEVSAKGGTIPAAQNSANLASAIASIPTGGAAHSYTGTFTTDANGEFTVHCGFKPDIVYIYCQTWDDETFGQRIHDYACIPLMARQTSDSELIANTSYVYYASSYRLAYYMAYAISDGFCGMATRVSSNWQLTPADNITVTYTAVGSYADQDEHNLFAGNSAPSSAANNDLWLDTSDEGGLPSVITAGDTPVLASSVMSYTRNATSMEASGIKITVPRAGTYRFKFSCARTATSGTFTTQLYKNGSAVSGATATWTNRQGSCSANISCNANDTIEIYCRSGSTSNYTILGQLIACIDWSIWG